MGVVMSTDWWLDVPLCIASGALLCPTQAWTRSQAESHNYWASARSAHTYDYTFPDTYNLSMLQSAEPGCEGAYLILLGKSAVHCCAYLSL